MALGQILTQSLSRKDTFVGPMRYSPPSLQPKPLSKDLNRLLSAAVVSPRFRRQLLADPAKALAAGYNGENFQLTPAEYAAVTSLRAGSIRDFAAQLLRMHQPATEDAALYAPEAQADFRFAEVAVR